MKRLLTLISLLFLMTAFGQTTCDKCNMEKVKNTNEHLNNLTLQLVNGFLCTFDSSCKVNVEFSEWSNETLFRVLDKAPNLFFQAVKGQSNIQTLVTEIQNPVVDGIDMQKLYDRLKTASGSKDIKKKFLDAVITAANKSGHKIRK